MEETSLVNSERDCHSVLTLPSGENCREGRCLLKSSSSDWVARNKAKSKIPDPLIRPAPCRLGASLGAPLLSLVFHCVPEGFPNYHSYKLSCSIAYSLCFKHGRLGSEKAM